MVRKDNFQIGIANILKNMRIKRGLSKTKMADKLYIDDKTWSRYEDGTTSPTAPELLRIFSVLGENVLPSILELIYPTTYEGLTSESDIADLRIAASHYMMNVASEKTVREFDYLVFGKHGSNIAPQMQLFTMYNHLPMQYRVGVARLVWTFWRLAESRGELIGTDHVMPDLEIFEEGLLKGEDAAFSMSNSYSTIQ